MTATVSLTSRRVRRRLIWAAAAALILLPLMALYVLAATDPTDNIALSRNEVVATADGGRLWRGRFWNHSDSLYTRLDTVVLFLDAEGKPVGQARGGAARLDPGEVFDFQARLPADAVRMQVYQLRWTNDGGPRVLGPYRPWPFGHLQDSECGPVRLRIGSCSPQRPIS